LPSLFPKRREEKRRGGEGGETESDFSTYAAIT
jgi:hypothetical protein